MSNPTPNEILHEVLADFNPEFLRIYTELTNKGCDHVTAQTAAIQIIHYRTKERFENVRTSQD